MISVRNLTREYGAVRAVAGLSFDLRPGSPWSPGRRPPWPRAAGGCCAPTPTADHPG